MQRFLFLPLLLFFIAGQLSQQLVAAPSSSAADLETFLGIPSQSFDGMGNGTSIEGSALKVTLNASAGQTFSFRYNFLTNEGSPSGFDPVNDFAFVTLSPTITTLADTFSPRLATQTSYGVESGYEYYSTTFTQSGTFTFGFGVVDVLDGLNDSALLLDDFRLSGVLLTNGSFENGSLSSFSTMGDVSTQTAAFGSPPPEGTYQALLTTSAVGVPEPSSIALALAGIMGTLAAHRRRQSTQRRSRARND